MLWIFFLTDEIFHTVFPLVGPLVSIFDIFYLFFFSSFFPWRLLEHVLYIIGIRKYIFSHCTCLYLLNLLPISKWKSFKSKLLKFFLCGVILSLLALDPILFVQLKIAWCQLTQIYSRNVLLRLREYAIFKI